MQITSQKRKGFRFWLVNKQLAIFKKSKLPGWSFTDEKLCGMFGKSATNGRLANIPIHLLRSKLEPSAMLILKIAKAPDNHTTY